MKKIRFIPRELKNGKWKLYIQDKPFEFEGVKEFDRIRDFDLHFMIKLDGYILFNKETLFPVQFDGKIKFNRITKCGNNYETQLKKGGKSQMFPKEGGKPLEFDGKTKYYKSASYINGLIAILFKKDGEAIVFEETGGKPFYLD